MKTIKQTRDAITECVTKLAAMPPNPSTVEEVVDKAYWSGQLNALEWTLE